MHYLLNISEQAKMKRFGCAVFMFAFLLSCTEQVGAHININLLSWNFILKTSFIFTRNQEMWLLLKVCCTLLHTPTDTSDNTNLLFFLSCWPQEQTARRLKLAGREHPAGFMSSNRITWRPHLRWGPKHDAFKDVGHKVPFPGTTNQDKHDESAFICKLSQLFTLLDQIASIKKKRVLKQFV